MDSLKLADDGLSATLAHGTFEMSFRLIPRGVYSIGLSDAGFAALLRLSNTPNVTRSELEPVIEVEVATAILVGERPFSVLDSQHLGLEIEGPPSYPAMLTLGEARSLTATIGCQLPNESEWEIACRGGATTLFVWGDDLPDTNELDRWLSWELFEEPAHRNGYGLRGLFFGEWCDEPFGFSHSPSAEVEEGSVVVKGGGAQFWPWQDEEWVWCMPAMRMPSSGLLDDGRCAARPVLRLSEGGL